MIKHEQQTGQFSFPSHDNPAKDPEYFNNILPNVFPSFQSNNGVMVSCFDLVSTHMTAASDGTRLVISMPTDKQHKDRIGELRIDFFKMFLNATSDQWLIEIKQSFAQQ